jgi:Ca-activated chloride channel family protein
MTFGAPLLLLVLLVVPAALVCARRLGRRNVRHAAAFTNLDLLAAVAAGTRRRWWRLLPAGLFLVALVAAATALAQPRARVPGSARRGTVVLLVDVSGSMAASDVKPTRLRAAQHALETFVARAPAGVRLALVSFSSTPDVLVPATADRGLMRAGIESLSPEGGTALGDAVATAVRVARSSPAAGDPSPGRSSRTIILLSDGAQTDGTLAPLQGAAVAARAGIPVDTVVLGTMHGTLAFPDYGTGGTMQLAVRPDPVTLAAIARATRGHTYRVATAARVDSVYRRLGSAVVRRTTSRELGSWFSGAAAFLLLASLALARLTGPRLP